MCEIKIPSSLQNCLQQELGAALNVPGVKQVLLSIRVLRPPKWQPRMGKPARVRQCWLQAAFWNWIFGHEDQQNQGHDFICLVLEWSLFSLFHQIAEQQALGKPCRGGNGKVAFCIIQVHGRMVQRPTTDQHKKCQFGRRTNQC